jgi:hypothetical protein
MIPNVFNCFFSEKYLLIGKAVIRSNSGDSPPPRQSLAQYTYFSCDSLGLLRN